MADRFDHGLWLHKIRSYIAQHDRAPTYAELGQAFGVSTAKAWGRVRTLETAGHLKILPGARGIQLADDKGARE